MIGGRGKAVRGVVCLAVVRWWSSAGKGAVRGAQQARSGAYSPAGEAVRACGRRDGVGGTRPKLHSASEYPVSGRIRTRSVQPELSYTWPLGVGGKGMTRSRPGAT
jgi:hypothetical protein